MSRRAAPQHHKRYVLADVSEKLQTLYGYLSDDGNKWKRWPELLSI